MKNYRIFIPPLVPINGAARASVFVTQMAERQHQNGKGRQPESANKGAEASGATSS